MYGPMPLRLSHPEEQQIWNQRLQHYLEDIIPPIQYANLSKTLNLVDGINIMNLENFSEEAQSLVIQSVADEVLNHWTKTILIIPEAWKFIPQKYNNPCKRIVESFVRQGAANRNFIWIDSQDMAGVDKIPLKSVATWILGLQSERNEVEHTLDQIPIPKKNKPREDEVMQLQKGHFFVCSPDQYAKVYVQPVWLDDEKAIEIAMGKLSVKDIHILFMKAGEKNDEGLIKLPLGNHKHWYPEVCYVLKGKCRYWLKNKEGETMETDLNEGELMYRAPEVTHTCLCTEDCILIDGAEQSWIDDNWNHVREVLK